MSSLRTAFRVARQERAFALDAVVILPDHLHAILTLPEGDANFWQRRFWEHTIRNERDFARHVDYIHYNPVKHGLVTRVADWPHSSFHLYVRRGLLPQDWVGDVGESAAGYGEP